MGIIDSLLLAQYGQQAFQLISWYLYERIGPDGSKIGYVLDESGNEIQIESAYELYDLILKINPNV